MRINPKVDASTNYRPHGVTRREAIATGGVAFISALIGGKVYGASGTVQPITRNPRPVFVFWLQGGPSHVDTFDLKTEGPEDYKSPYKPIYCKNGVQLPELLPRTARIIDKILIVRNMSHRHDAHGHATAYTLTTNPLLRSDRNDERFNRPMEDSAIVQLSDQIYDGRGFVVLRAIPERKPYGSIQENRALCYVEADFVREPDFKEDTNQGLRELERFYTGDYRFPCPFAGMSSSEMQRLSDRLGLREALGRHFAVQNQALDRHERIYQSAAGLVDPQRLIRAFDLDRVDPRERDRAGRNSLGNATVVMCNLIEAGVPIGIVTHGFYDTHGNNKGYLDLLLPAFDNAFTYAHERLGGDVNFVIGGEFGRTPKINGSAGRDHHTRAYSVAFAGPDVNVTRGVIGTTDRTGENIIAGGENDAKLFGPTIARLGGHRLVNGNTREILNTLDIFKNER